jgi:tetratricopeptide (TPR) repeat protein
MLCFLLIFINLKIIEVAIPMRIKIDRAIEMRRTGKQKESNELLIKLVNEYPDDAFINYQCAWSFDVLGFESKAVPYYEKAIQLGLSGKDLEGAIIGLGSTYRTLGEYKKSKKVFQKGINLYTNNVAFKVFYSMTLYNLKEHGQAMELLLNSLIETTTNEEILDYKKAIGFYSDKLDQTWT